MLGCSNHSFGNLKVKKPVKKCQSSIYIFTCITKYTIEIAKQRAECTTETCCRWLACYHFNILMSFPRTNRRLYIDSFVKAFICSDYSIHRVHFYFICCKCIIVFICYPYFVYLSKLFWLTIFKIKLIDL